MVLAPDQLIHLGPDPAGASWNHFNLGLGLSSHVDYAQSALKNSPPQGQPWWYSKTNVSGKDVVVFSAPLGGATTSTNTQYARCELREFERDGTTKMAFDPTSGDHWIEGIYRIYGLSGLSKPGVCVQQAHDPDDDVIMVCTVLSGGAVKLVLRFNGTQVAVLNSSYSDGTEFYLKTRVNNGTPEVYYTTNLASIPSTPTYTSSGFFSGAAAGWYYKTGSYNQTNESTDSGVDANASIIRVEVRELKHWHSSTPKGGAWPTPATYAAAGTPTVNAGADGTVSTNSTFRATGTISLNGATLTSQQWSITAGPSGVGSVLSTTAALAWTPTVAGIFTLEYRAVTSAGTFTDTATVTVTTASTPVDTNTAAGRLGWGTPSAVDEFNASGAPNASNWSVYNGPGHNDWGVRNPSRIALDGTKAVITGVAGSADTGGMAHKFGQRYGKWEVRARSQSTGGGTTGFTAQVFVSPTGSDSNTGRSAASPKKTIAAAISAANAGETISVADGTYSGNVVTSKGGSSSGGYITVRAANKWAAIISGNDATSDEAGISVNNSYLRFQDLTVTGTSSSGIRNGIVVAADNVQIIGCHIYNICQFLTDGTSWLGGAGIDFSGPNRTNIVIERNNIHDVGLRSSTEELVHGIYCGVHGTSFRIQNNLIWECEGFGVHPYDPTEASGIEIINNTVVSCGWGILQGPNGITRNNIVHNCPNQSYDIRGSGNVGSNNKYSSSGAPTGTNVGWASISSPGFVNASTSGTPDFHLTSSSVLIGAGTSTNAPATDYDGGSRPVSTTYDVGAFEFGSTPAGGGGTSTEVYRPVALLWPDAENWPQGAEYDFWELDGPDRTAFQAFMHFPSLDGSDSQRQFTANGYNSNDFHNYAIEWTPDNLVGYVDGVEVYRTSGGATTARRNIQDAPGPMHLALQFDPTAATGLGAGKMEIDWIRVYPLTPVDGGPIVDPGGGGGTPLGTYPSFVAAGTPVSASDGTSSVAVPAPSGVANGHFQICAILCATSAESISAAPAGWQLLDEQAVTTVAGGDSGDTQIAWIYYNTTGDSATRTWTKSGTRGFHAVRMAWKNMSSLGQHTVRVSSSTLTPYATPVTPTIDKAIAVAVLFSDRLNTGAGPVTTPNGWTSRYNNALTVNGDEIETIVVADINVDNRTVAGANVPSGTGLGTSNFTLTNADACSMFSFVIEGAISTGTVFTGSLSLVAQHRLVAGLTLPPVGSNALLLTAFPQLLIRALLPTSVSFWVIPNLSLNVAVFPRGAMIILPTLTFTERQVSFAGLLLQALGVLQTGALPYRKPVIRTDYKYPPVDHPFRLIAQRILDGEIVEWELPVSEDFEYTDQLSGPVVMQGSFRPEQISVQELGLDGYAYWLHVEINQEIRASAILLPPQYQESEMSFSAEGVAAVPHYAIYDNVYSQIQVDPLSVVRTLWNYVQNLPQSDYGVVLSSNSSPVRIGEPATTETTTTQNSDGTTSTTTRTIEAKPYELNWWDAKNIGEEIDSLAGATPFDYVERHQWNADRTDVLHYIDLGYPRLGVARPTLLFNEENILEVVPVQEPEDTYASAVLVIGAGDGADTIRAFRAAPFGDRVRKQVVVTDKSITNQQLANARADHELAFRRGRAFEISEIVINAYHPNAPIGSYRTGDDIQVQVEIPWLMELHASWYRITSIQNKPSSDKIRLGLARSDTLLDTSDIWIEPDDYVPFTPPPPIGALNWNGNVLMLVRALLSVTPPVPIPTANVVLIITPGLTANGFAFGGSFAFMNLYADTNLLVSGTGSQPGTVVLNPSAALAANGLVTAAGFALAQLNVRSALTLGPTTTIIGAGTGGFGSTPFGSTPFGGGSGGTPGVVLNAAPSLTVNGVVSSPAISISFTATNTLTVGGVVQRPASVSLSASTTLSANGTISGGTTTSQLGNTTNGTGSSSSSANKTVVSKATSSVDGTVTVGHARLWVDSGTVSVKMCVYSDSSGDPNSLLGLSDALTVSNTTEALKDFTFSGAQQASIASGTDYWVGFTWPDPGTNNISWSRGTTAGQAQQNSLNAASSFGTPGTALSGPIDAYVDVVSGSGGGGGGGTGPEVSAVSPAMMKNANASSLTSAAFNAPAGSVIVVCAHSDGAFNGHNVTNNGTVLSWQTIGIQCRSAGGSTGSAAAFVAVCPSARSGLTVTWDSGAGPDDVGVKVYVITGADTTDPLGANVKGTSISNVLTTAAITVEKANSLCFVVADNFSAGGTTTATGLDAFNNYDVSGSIAGGSGYKTTGAAGSSVTLSLDAAGTGAADWNYVAFEIRGA